MSELARPAPPLSPRAQALADRVDRIVAALARRWLALSAVLAFTLTTLPFVAAALRASGRRTLALPIDLAYRLICHQRDDRSFRLAGEPLAFCQRDLAIFSSALAIVLAFAVARRRLPVGGITLRHACWLALPMLLDGVTQLTGLRESSWELRLVTGALFALGVGLYALPRLERGFATLRAETEARLAAGQDATRTKVTTP